MPAPSPANPAPTITVSTSVVPSIEVRATVFRMSGAATGGRVASGARSAPVPSMNSSMRLRIRAGRSKQCATRVADDSSRTRDASIPVARPRSASAGSGAMSTTRPMREALVECRLGPPPNEWPPIATTVTSPPVSARRSFQSMTRLPAGSGTRIERTSRVRASIGRRKSKSATVPPPGPCNSTTVERRVMPGRARAGCVARRWATAASRRVAHRPGARMELLARRRSVVGCALAPPPPDLAGGARRSRCERAVRLGARLGLIAPSSSRPPRSSAPPRSSSWLLAARASSTPPARGRSGRAAAAAPRRAPRASARSGRPPAVCATCAGASAGTNGIAMNSVKPPVSSWIAASARRWSICCCGVSTCP